jgi:hypothetical protein
MRTQYDTIIVYDLLLLVTRLGLYVDSRNGQRNYPHKFDTYIEANVDGTFE